jgi:hypothetical protein
VDDIGVPPPFNPKQVLVNGAAVGLISALVESVREDMRAMEGRVSGSMNAYWTAHDELHDRQDIVEMDTARRVRERLTELEKWQTGEQTRLAVEAARAEGRRSVYRMVITFVTTNERWLMSLVGLLTGIVVAWLGTHIH